MILDNFGAFIASLLCNVGGAQQIKNVLDEDGVTRANSAVGWGTIAGRYGIWGANNGSPTGTPYVRLGSGMTPVARSDFNVETPLIGTEGAMFNVSLGSGYGSNIVQTLQTIGPFTTAQTVREGGLFIQGARTASDLAQQKFMLMRFNYTPVSVGIGESVSMDTTILI